MDITLFELHLNDVAVAVSGGPEASASTDPDATEAADASDERGFPRAVFLLVPVFVVLGVALGFLADRYFGTDEPTHEEPGIDVELSTEMQ